MLSRIWETFLACACVSAGFWLVAIVSAMLVYGAARNPGLVAALFGPGVVFLVGRAAVRWLARFGRGARRD